MLWPAHDYARRTGAAFVLTPLTHLGEGEGSIVRQRYTPRHQITLQARADRVLTRTGVEARYLASCGVPGRVLTDAGAGVNPGDLAGGDEARFRSKHGIDGPFVIFVGTAAFDKGAEHLVRVLERLWERGEPDLVLVGLRLSAFDRFLAARPAETRRRCHVLGIVSEEDKLDALAACNLMAMPSRTDSLGLIYLESWCYGKPMIGARAGGIPDVIVDGEDGSLVRFGDVGGSPPRSRGSRTAKRPRARWASAGATRWRGSTPGTRSIRGFGRPTSTPPPAPDERRRAEADGEPMPDRSSDEKRGESALA